jgi:hypothetical protein
MEQQQHTIFRQGSTSRDTPPTVSIELSGDDEAMEELDHRPYSMEMADIRKAASEQVSGTREELLLSMHQIVAVPGLAKNYCPL